MDMMGMNSMAGMGSSGMGSGLSGMSGMGSSGLGGMSGMGGMGAMSGMGGMGGMGSSDMDMIALYRAKEKMAMMNARRAMMDDQYSAMNMGVPSGAGAHMPGFMDTMGSSDLKRR